MSRCRKCGQEVYPGTRCSPCARRWGVNRLAAFKQCQAEGLVIGSPEFTKRLHKLEKAAAKAEGPEPLGEGSHPFLGACACLNPECHKQVPFRCLGSPSQSPSLDGQS